MSSHVSLLDLLEETKKVTDWYMLGLYLKMESEDLKDIEQKYSSEGLKRYKIELFSLWTKRNPNASWAQITMALEKCDENETAERIRERHPQPTLDLTDPAVNNTNEPTLVCLEKEKVENFMKLERQYAQLTFNLKTSLEEKQVPLLKLGRYLIDLLEEDEKLLQADTIDKFFQLISPHYCFLNTVILKEIVLKFIGEPLKQQLEEYESRLDEIKESTSMSLLQEIGPQCSPSVGGPRVTIKLATCWQNVTINRFQRLVEQIFAENSTTLAHIHVKKGCISVSWYTRKSAVPLLVACAQNKIDLLRISDVLKLIVSDTVIFEQEEIKEEDMSFVNSALLRITARASIMHIPGKHMSDLEAVEFLLYHGANPNCSLKGMTPLMFACQHRSIRIATKLLQAGANINLQDIVGASALTFACCSESPNKDLVKLLLQSGADINARGGEQQRTILMLSMLHGNTSIVQYLLDEGASVNTQDRKGDTALMLASSSGHSEIVRLLLNYGADINIVGKGFGFTALSYACILQHTVCVDLLLASGADPNLHGRKISPLIATCFVFHQKKDPTILEMLLSAGAKPNTITEDGVTALMATVIFAYEKGVEILLNAAADVNIHTQSSATALHLAATIGHLAICKLLLASGAQPSLKDHNGDTPLDLALSNNHHDVCQLLQTHMKEIGNTQPSKQSTTTDPPTTQERSKPVQDISQEPNRRNILPTTKTQDIFSIIASLSQHMKDILLPDRTIKLRQSNETQEAASPVLTPKN